MSNDTQSPEDDVQGEPLVHQSIPHSRGRLTTAEGLTEAEREALVRAAVAYYARSRKGKGADPDYLLHSNPASLPVTLALDVTERLVPTVERILADRLAAVQAERDALRERVEALADDWNDVPDYTPSAYDQGRVDQRHMMTMELLEVLEDPRAALDADR